MDGVLVDFERGVVDTINKQLAVKTHSDPKQQQRFFKNWGEITSN